jgi:hypothetical protein
MINLNDFSHSHDSLEIVPWNQQSCVRKIFRSNLDRAQRNVEKQRKFKPFYTAAARVAAADVLEFKIFSDRAELLMPYIEGMTGHIFSVHASRNVAHTLSSSLSTLLYAELNESREEAIPTLLFKSKLLSVAEATSDPELQSLINSMIDVVGMLSDEIIFPVGPCHGDLTLSNLILDMGSGVTLIDFLDTYLDSPLQDVAKLKQDFVYGWSFRNAPSSLRIKAEILCRQHYPAALVQIERMYPVQVRLVMLMTLARIAPYVRDSATKNWLTASLKHCMKVSII